MTLARRDFLRTGLYGGAFLAVARGGLAPRVLAALADAAGLKPEAMETLAAAADIIVPEGVPFALDGEAFTEPAGGEDLGAYLTRLLAEDGLYFGGPTRAEFGRRVDPHPAKRLAWRRDVEALRWLLATGAEMLDDVARQFRGRPFAELSAQDREGILRGADTGMLDMYSVPRFHLHASELFDALFALTMESVYSDPEYKHPGSGKDTQQAWRRLGYAGDQFSRDTDGNLTGGFSAEELGQPGAPSPNPYGPGMGPGQAQMLLAASAGVRATMLAVQRALLLRGRRL